MTRDEVLTLPPMINLVTAAKALGIGRTTAYTLAHTGRFPCRLLKVGSRYRVPTNDLLAVLGITTNDASLDARTEQTTNT